MIEALALAAMFWFTGAVVLKGHPRYQQNIGRATKRPGRGRGASRLGGGRRFTGESWVIKAWNASGARKTEEKTLGGAAAVLGGKAAGNTVRFTKRAGHATGRTVHGKVLRPAARAARAASSRRGPSGPADPTPTQPLPRTEPRPRPGSRRWPPAGTDEPAPAGTETTTGKAIPLSVDQATTDQPATSTYAPAPPSGDWAQVIARINSFTPDTDHQLIAFMQRESAGMLGYATAMIQLFENCVTGKGLDPTAMQGIADYSAASGECGQAMVLAHRRFVTVYNEIMQAVQKGVVMPHDGRFFTSEAS